MSGWVIVLLVSCLSDLLVLGFSYYMIKKRQSKPKPYMFDENDGDNA